MGGVIDPRKQARIDRLANPRGVIAALAMDQRKSLRAMMAAASGRAAAEIGDDLLAGFKNAVSLVLSRHVSAILLDTEYGSEAMKLRTGSCGLLVTYESDGYENPRPHRMPALMPHLSALRIGELGGDAVKILLSWAPDDDARANDEKRAMMERIGGECEAVGLPFFLEPVVYDPQGLDPKSAEWARRKPNLVVRTIEEFSQTRYRVDVLKVEFPVNAGFASGTWTRAEAREWFRAADSAARLPYVYLSAGISGAEFRESLILAAEAGAKFSGVLCGRATWQDALPVYARSGSVGLHAWLADEGVRNVRAIDECLLAATPWRTRSVSGEGRML